MDILEALFNTGSVKEKHIDDQYQDWVNNNHYEDIIPIHDIARKEGKVRFIDWIISMLEDERSNLMQLQHGNGAGEIESLCLSCGKPLLIMVVPADNRCPTGPVKSACTHCGSKDHSSIYANGTGKATP